MSNSTRTRFGLLCATMMSTAMIAGPALAQSEPAADAGADNEDVIIVSATRRNTTLIETPINISAIGGDTLASERIDDVRDLGAFTPGVTILDNGPRGAGTVVMRGLSASDTIADGGNNSDSSIGMYLGDVPMYYDFKLIDMNRVEVLLGPQGTLYGLGTLAGAMRYMPNRPDPSAFTVEASGRVFDMAHSSDVGYSGYAVLNIPLGDSIAFRTATGYYDTPGFIDYPYTLQTPGVSLPQPGGLDNPMGSAEDQAANFNYVKDVNYEHTFTTRNQLGIEGEGFQVYVTYAYQETKTGGRQATGDGIVGEGRYQGPWRYTEPAKRVGNLASLEFTGNVSDVFDLVVVSSYTERDTTFQGDVTDLLLDLDYGYELFPAFSGYTASRQRQHEYTQEVRLVSTHAGPFSWVLGGFWNRQNYSSRYTEFVPGYPEWAGIYRPDNAEYASYVNSKNDEKGVYGEATFEITDDWQVTGGLRYYKYDAFIEGGTTLPLWDEYPDFDFSYRAGETSDDGLVYKINTSYNITPDIMVWGTYSTGYRIGGVNRVAPCELPIDESVQNLCALPNELEYGPDKVKNAEIGVRAQLMGGRLMMSLSGFQVKWNGIQLDGQTQYGAIGITSNGGTAKSKGIDFSFTANPLPGLNIRGNYSYLDAYLTEDVPMLLSVAGGDLVDVHSGDRLPGSAKNSGALGATYELPVGMDALIAGWTATYTGNVYTRVGLRGGGEKLPGYVMHRANLTYRTETFDITLFANNLFDKYAITGVSNDLTRRGIVNDGVISRYYARSVAQPRTIGLEGRVRF